MTVRVAGLFARPLARCDGLDRQSVDRSPVQDEGQYYSPSKTRGFVCENGLRNVHPHASLVFSLLCADRAVEMGHPRFTGCVRSLTSSGPLGPISCLDLACKENSRRSQADSE
ncbi:hypothetical protein JOQ06_016726, partial [Pogonophryne albipinna]